MSELRFPEPWFWRVLSSGIWRCVLLESEPTFSRNVPPPSSGCLHGVKPIGLPSRGVSQDSQGRPWTVSCASVIRSVLDRRAVRSTLGWRSTIGISGWNIRISQLLRNTVSVWGITSSYMTQASSPPSTDTWTSFMREATEIATTIIWTGRMASAQVKSSFHLLPGRL
jgi:hypothetical protein